MSQSRELHNMAQTDPESVSLGNMFLPHTLEDSIVPLKGARGSLPTCGSFPQEELIIL